MKTLVAEMTEEELREAIIPNEVKLRKLFPEEFTPAKGIRNSMQIMFHFKLYGLDWRDEDDFIRICVAMHGLNILEMSPCKTMARRSPHVVNLH